MQKSLGRKRLIAKSQATLTVGDDYAFGFQFPYCFYPIYHHVSWLSATEGEN